MAFMKKKKAPILSRDERNRIKKLLEDEAIKFKRPIKMQFIYRTPSGIEYIETSRFRNEDEGLAYGKQKEDQLKSLDKKWELVLSKIVNSSIENQHPALD